jgi:hypothetical protein
MPVSMKKAIKRWSNIFKKKKEKGAEDANLLKPCKRIEGEDLCNLFNSSFNTVTTAASDLSLSPTSIASNLSLSPERYSKSAQWDLMMEENNSAKYAHDYEEASPSAAEKYGHIASDLSMSPERYSKIVPQWGMTVTEIPPPAPVFKADQDTSSAKYAYDYEEASTRPAEKYVHADATPDDKANCGYGDATTPDDKKAKPGYGDATPDAKAKHGFKDAIPSKQRDHNMHQYRRGLHPLPGGVLLTIPQEPRRRPNRCGAEGRGTTHLGGRPPRPPSSTSKSSHSSKLEKADKKAKRDGSYGNGRPKRVQFFPAIVDRSAFSYC